MKKNMKDVQSMKDTRNVYLDKVGIKGITYPIVVKDRARGFQHTVAKVNMYVDLPKEFKGTHMSRFLEILNKYKNEISIMKISEILSEMKERLNAENAHLELEFPYFIEKIAPISGERSLMNYTCFILGQVGSKKDFIQGVEVPITSLCPCSKEISKYGAHNQRSYVKAFVRTKKFLWLEEQIEMVERCGSCEVYSLLKREDEKYVTEKAYENPVFVEDIVRNLVILFNKEERITWYKIEAENFESIHNHSAYASVEVKK